MRKVAEKIARAMENGNSCKVGNTETDGENVWLHGNLIAKWNGDTLCCTLAGWNTVTTRSRLNDICQYLTGTRPFHQKDFEPYFGAIQICSREWIAIPVA